MDVETKLKDELRICDLPLCEQNAERRYARDLDKCEDKDDAEEKEDCEEEAEAAK